MGVHRVNAGEPKSGVWGRIVALEGHLAYGGARGEETALGPDATGIAEPEVVHEDELLGKVRFFFEFHRQAALQWETPT